MRVGGTGTLKGGGTKKKGWETKILKRGRGKLGRGVCASKRGEGAGTPLQTMDL